MFMLRSFAAILFAMFLANCSVAADPEQTDREMGQAAGDAREKLKASIKTMFVAMSADDSDRRRVAFEAFHAFRINAVQMKLFSEEWHFAPADANDREGTVAIYGALLLMPYGGCPSGDHFEPAWEEYCRFFDDKNPRIRMLAFTHAARSMQTARTESAAATLRGCRDPSPAMRTAAFRYLAKLLRERRGNEKYLPDARDCVVHAVCNDHEVAREHVYRCAASLGKQVSDVADELQNGMHGEDCVAAAEALARVDPTPARIERVIAALRDDDNMFLEAALAYFHRLPDGRACPALVRTLARLLASPESTIRSKAFQIVLDNDYAALHSLALAVAEALLNDPDFYDILDPHVIEAIGDFAQKNPVGIDLFRKCLRHPDEYVASQFLWRIEYRWPSSLPFFANLTLALLNNPHPDLNKVYLSTMRRTWDQLKIDPLSFFTPSSSFASN